MTSTAQAGHLYYVLRSRLDPSTYKPGITSSMGRRLRQHGGQERWEVVGVYDLGPRKAYTVEQLILQRFDACRLNAAGEYLKLTDGQLEELLQIVSEATSKRYQPKTAEVKAPKPPAPAPRPTHTVTPVPVRRPAATTSQSTDPTLGSLLLYLIGVPLVAMTIAGVFKPARQVRPVAVAQPAPIEAPKPVVGELAKPMVETPVVEPVKAEGPSEKWLAEKRTQNQRWAEEREAEKQRILKEAEVAREWLRLNSSPMADILLTVEANKAIERANQLSRPKNLSEDLARIKAQRAEPVVLQPMPIPVSLP